MAAQQKALLSDATAVTRSCATFFGMEHVNRESKPENIDEGEITMSWCLGSYNKGYIGD